MRQESYPPKSGLPIIISYIYIYLNITIISSFDLSKKRVELLLG